MASDGPVLVVGGTGLLGGQVVTELVAQGRSNAEIADLLVIAESTAKTHVKRLLAKIDAHDRAQAVVFAYRSGLIVDSTPA